jgi:hypothetical protein
VAFTGEVEGMEGKVFDLSSTDGTKQVVSYEDTLKKLKKHVGNKFENGADVTKSMDQMRRVEIPLPEDLPEGASAAATRAWNKKIDMAVINDNKLTCNLERLFLVIVSQSSEGLLTKVREQTAWKEVEESRDGLGVLKLVRNVMQDYQDNVYGPAQSYKTK